MPADEARRRRLRDLAREPGDLGRQRAAQVERARQGDGVELLEALEVFAPRDPPLEELGSAYLCRAELGVGWARYGETGRARRWLEPLRRELRRRLGDELSCLALARAGYSAVLSGERRQAIADLELARERLATLRRTQHPVSSRYGGTCSIELVETVCAAGRLDPELLPLVEEALESAWASVPLTAWASYPGTVSGLLELGHGDRLQALVRATYPLEAGSALSCLALRLARRLGPLAGVDRQQQVQALAESVRLGRAELYSVADLLALLEAGVFEREQTRHWATRPPRLELALLLHEIKRGRAELEALRARARTLELAHERQQDRVGQLSFVVELSECWRWLVLLAGERGRTAEVEAWIGEQYPQVVAELGSSLAIGRLADALVQAADALESERLLELAAASGWRLYHSQTDVSGFTGDGAALWAYSVLQIALGAARRWAQPPLIVSLLERSRLALFSREQDSFDRRLALTAWATAAYAAEREGEAEQALAEVLELPAGAELLSSSSGVVQAIAQHALDLPRPAALSFGAGLCRRLRELAGQEGSDGPALALGVVRPLAELAVGEP